MKNPIILSALFFAIWLTALIAAQPQPAPPASFLSVLKKGQDINLKETPAGYRITIGGLGTHKIVGYESDYVTVTDAIDAKTIRINKNALLSITTIDPKLLNKE